MKKGIIVLITIIILALAFFGVGLYIQDIKNNVGMIAAEASG